MTTALATARQGQIVDAPQGKAFLISDSSTKYYVKRLPAERAAKAVAVKIPTNVPMKKGTMYGGKYYYPV